MKKWRYVAVSVLAVILLAGVCVWREQHLAYITYKVMGNVGGSSFIISYLDTPTYAPFNTNRCRVVHVSQSELPWTINLRLPYSSYTYMNIENESGKKSLIFSSQTIDGQTVWHGMPGDPTTPKVESDTFTTWIYGKEQYLKPAPPMATPLPPRMSGPP